MTSTEDREYPNVVELPAHMSYSQGSSFQHCGWQQMLERVWRVPSRPSWATVGGSAVHKATEWWDNWTLEGNWVMDQKEHARLFNEAFDAEIKERQEFEPDFTPDQYRASGRATKQWPNKEDESWWRENGPAMVSRWAVWRSNNASWEILRHDDLVGIELDFNVELGGKPTKGFIDRLFQRNESELMVVDLKSGREPDQTKQLGLYGVALAMQYELTPTWGAYWVARTGGTSVPVDLRLWPRERIEHEFQVVNNQRARGEFLPKESNMCGSCAVRDYCFAVGGEKAAGVPLPWEISIASQDTSADA